MNITSLKFAFFTNY